MLLQPKTGPAIISNANTLASARGLRPDRHDPLNRRIMTVMKIPSAAA
jgi:hypothetical protein